MRLANACEEKIELKASILKAKDALKTSLHVPGLAARPWPNFEVLVPPAAPAAEHIPPPAALAAEHITPPAPPAAEHIPPPAPPAAEHIPPPAPPAAEHIPPPAAPGEEDTPPLVAPPSAKIDPWPGLVGNQGTSFEENYTEIGGGGYNFGIALKENIQ